LVSKGNLADGWIFYLAYQPSMKHFAFILIALPLLAGPVNIMWAPSPDDSGNGYYTISYLPTNAPSIVNQMTLTNVPSGQTNINVTIPVSPCFLFATFTDTNLNLTSTLSAPCYYTASVKPPTKLQHL
jgi:hypothetical protein